MWFINLRPLANKERYSVKVFLYNKLGTIINCWDIGFADSFIKRSSVKSARSFNSIK